MIYVISIAVFAAVGILFYVLYGRMQTAVQRSVFRQKEHVARQLEEMFIFISVEGLQKLKWSLAMGLAGIGLLLAWETKPPAPMIRAAILGVLGY